MAKILVVDDDAELLESTRSLLESEGHAVVSAASGREGLDKAKAEKPNLMLLDVMMAHDGEGFEVARQVRETPETRGMPVILVTGIRKVQGLPFRYEPDPEWLPVQAVLEKPVAPGALLQAIGEALRTTS